MLVDKMHNKKKQFPDVLKKSMGIVTTACNALSISRTTYYKWREADADFAAACDEAQETTLDHVESKLMENIDVNDTACILFYMKTKGKKRGYVERSEITGKDGGAIQTEQLNESQVRLYERGIKNIEAAAVARYKASLEETSGNNSMA
jgi:hypothetical protein